MGLVVDLNKTTRFSTLSVGASGNAETLMQTTGWMTGFPVRTGFGRGFPEHDPWRFDTARLIESGEADVVIWIASAAAEPPVLGLTLSACRVDPTGFGSRASEGTVAVGRHGHDHDTIEFVRDVQALACARRERRKRPAERRRNLGRDCDVAFPRGGVMLTCLRGGRIIDPANGGERVGDLFIEGERIVAEPLGPKSGSNLRCDRQNRDGRRDRHPLAYCRRQCKPAACFCRSCIRGKRRHPPTCRSPARAGRPSRPAASTRRWASPPWSSRRCRPTMLYTPISSSPIRRSSTRRS